MQDVNDQENDVDDLYDWLMQNGLPSREIFNDMIAKVHLDECVKCLRHIGY